MNEYDLISKTALLRHLDMATECKNCPRNADKDLYKCIHNPTSELCTCSEIAQICIRITDFEAPAEVQPVNQWISVKDRLPENCIEVLVYDTDCGIVMGWYDKEIGDFAADFISPLDAVTHWIPLPEPPKDGDTNE